MRYIYLLVILISGCGSRSSSSTKNIFGIDDRTPLHNEIMPYKAIGSLNTGCTATLISENIAITAAHCIYTYSGSLLSEQIVFTTSSYIDSTVRNSRVKVLYTGTSTPYADTSTYDLDWTFIELEEALGRHYGYIDLAMAQPNVGDSISIAGFSGDYMNGKIATIHRNCRVRGLNNQSFLHDCDLTRGASGGPVLATLLGHTGLSIIGIESGERRLNGTQSLVLNYYEDQYANVAVSSSQFFEIAKNLINR